MEAKKCFEPGKYVYITQFDSDKNELFYITAKVVDVVNDNGEVFYACRCYNDSKLYTVSEKDVFETYQEVVECSKNYKNAKIKMAMEKINLSDIEKLKIAYEVIRDLETRDDIKGLKNAITSVKNLIANDIAFECTFG